MSAKASTVATDRIETFEEEIGMSTYTRIDHDASTTSLIGKRVPGHGKITSVTNPVGEHHPTFVRFDDSEALPRITEIMGYFDGRHNFIID
jgi:hypothetical protein